MTKIFRLVLSAVVTLGVAVAATLALSAPAQAMTVDANANTNPSNQVVKVTLSDVEVASILTSPYFAGALCTDASDGVVAASSSWFDWSVPSPNGLVGSDRCSADLYACVQAGGRSVTYVNYAGFWGWTYWADTCNR